MKNWFNKRFSKELVKEVLEAINENQLTEEKAFKLWGIQRARPYLCTRDVWRVLFVLSPLHYKIARIAVSIACLSKKNKS